jgi:hypothetical protein
MAEQRAEDGVGVGLAQPAEAHRTGPHRRLECAGLGAVQPEAVQRGEQLEAHLHPPLPRPERLAGGRHRVQRQAPAEEQRVAHARALVAALRQPERRAQVRPGAQQVQAPPGGRVDRDDGLAAEAEHRARDRRHVAGLVERRDELGRAIGPAARVQAAELLLAGLGRYVDTAVAHR